MSRSRIPFALATAVVVAGARPHSPARRDTPPIPTGSCGRGKEHLSLAREDAVLPRATVNPAGRAVSSIGAAYATDPDRGIYGQLGREHLALSHTVALLPRSHIDATRLPHGTALSPAQGDPDARLRQLITRERNVY